MRTCPACDKEIDGESIEEGICRHCGAEITYGSEGCAG